MEDREEPQAGSTSHRPLTVSARGNRPWHLFLMAGLAVGVFALAWSEVGAPASSSRVSRQVVLAQRGVVQSTVSGTGNVEAGTDVSVSFQVSGTLADVFVKVGDHVSQGQLLATLDPTSAQLSVAQAEKTLTAAKDQLKAARQTSTSSTTTGASLQTNGGGSAEFVSETVRHVPSTTTATTTTTTRTQGTPRPRPKRRTSGKTTVPQTTTTTTTPASTQAAPQGTTTTAAGSSSASGTTSPSTKAANIATAQASVYSAEANLRSAETSVSNTKLYAPTSGTIVSLSTLQPGDQVSGGSSSNAAAGSSSGGSSSGSSGTGTTAGSLGGSSSSSSSSSGSSSSAFAEIVNTDTMTMTVALSESDVTKVRVGQPATITLDALSGVELGAHVSQIATVGTTSSSVVSYSATLTLDQLDRRVKAGMSASASVITGQAGGVTVPNSAISGSGTLATVPLMRGSKTVQQQVVVGLKGDSRTQIVSGLTAGDQLVVTTTLPSLGSGSSASSGGSNGTLGGGRGFGGGGFPGGGFPGGGPPGGGGG